ncbi:MAG TPA: cytochrome c [Solirubrobacterales bacterium]|nr:cytochrome c [Solirubrobacterales bacterium]
MSKRTFIVFGLLVVVLAVAIPWLVFDGKGDAKNGAQEVPSSLEKGQELFKINCGNCHTLYAAGTDGNYGPDLDELLAPNGVPPEADTEKELKEVLEPIEGRVESAIENGVDGTTTTGRMPPEILNEEQAKEVAAFVAATAGEG